jgi:hypothetical protein
MVTPSSPAPEDDIVPDRLEKALLFAREESPFNLISSPHAAQPNTIIMQTAARAMLFFIIFASSPENLSASLAGTHVRRKRNKTTLNPAAPASSMPAIPCSLPWRNMISSLRAVYKN